MTGASILAMSTRDLYATISHNVHEKKTNNGQQAPDNSSSAVPPGCSNLSGAGASSRSSRDPCDSPVTARSPVETVPNTARISPAMAKKVNDDIKHQLMKEVRRCGRNYERIFILLDEVQGSMEVKKQLVKFTIKEAARLKNFA
uniref:sarcoma antigen 1-like isoform X2 n=1 Tax=Callithrix jacchus TaxID=9483 RepID=UPI0023DD16F6|nr:sarcoma antigen 1-like isoform X2 [Callithrix jacchus]